MATHGRGSSVRSDRWMKPPQPPTSAACALFIHAAQMKCSPFVCSYRGRPTIRVSLCLTLTPPFSLSPPFMTMSMTNHGQHVKNLSWNIWAVNLAAASRRRNTVPLLVDFVFLKLVHKYCYKCVESKQLETNERSTGFPYLLVYLWHDLKWVAYNLWIIWKTRAPLESLTLNRMPNQITWVHKYNWNMLLFGLCRTYDNISIGQHDKNK